MFALAPAFAALAVAAAGGRLGPFDGAAPLLVLSGLAFVTAAGDQTLDVISRLRAIEILVELFGGIDAKQAARLAASDDPAVRARVAWAVGRKP